MSGLRSDGKPLGPGEVPDDWFYLHHLFRLHGIPPHEFEQWEPGWKRAAYISIGLQLEDEIKRRNAGLGG